MKTPPDDWDEHERDLPEELAGQLSNLRSSATALPIDVLRAAGADVLPDDLERTALQHLAQDPRARALVDELNASATLDSHSEARLYARISRETQSMPQRRLAPWLWRAAAAVGAVTILGATWWTLGRERATESAVAVAQPPAAAPAASTPAPTQPETFQLPLEKPEIRISLRSLTWRGAERGNPVLAALKPALDAFRAGDYRRADEEFSVVGRTHPNLIEVALYQGVSRLFLNDVAGAKVSLQSAEKIGDAVFANDVAWYQAIADERSGDRAAARARLVQLCPNAAGDPRACAAIEIK